MGLLNAPGTRSRTEPLDLGAAAVSLVALVVLTVAAALVGPSKTAVIATASFGAMALGALLAGREPRRAGVLAGVTGVAAGAMVTSAAAFLVPVAVKQSATLGGMGVALGLLLGHLLHHLTETTDAATPSAGGPALLDGDVLRLTAHAASAGVVIGAIYGGLPGVGLLLGLSIVSHKGPAGYAAALRLRRQGRSAVALGVPAAALGIPATALGMAGVGFPAPVAAVVFGVAAGVFLHVALDHLHVPARDDEQGGNVQGASLGGAFAGGALVVALWLVVGAG